MLFYYDIFKYPLFGTYEERINKRIIPEKEELNNILFSDLINNKLYEKIYYNINEEYKKHTEEDNDLKKLIEDKHYEVILCKKRDEYMTIVVIINIDMKIMEEIYKKNKKKEIYILPCEDELKKLLFYDNGYKELSEEEDDRDVKKSIMEYVNYGSDKRIEDNITKLKLYEYQKCNIKWMLDIEQRKEKINKHEIVKFGNLIHDMYTNDIYHKDEEELRFKGGCLADEVGLGKTIQMITLTLKNQPKNIDYFKKINGEYELCSSATLILCPNHLCNQWKKEFNNIKKEYNPRIIMLTTKRHYEYYTYQDILDADYVIISFTFLNNKVFKEEWIEMTGDKKNNNCYTWNEEQLESAQRAFKKMRDELTDDEVLLDMFFKTNVQIQIIRWHRIIVDEFHEIYKDKYTYVENLLKFIKAKYKWIVSATPLIKNENRELNSMLDYLTDYYHVKNGYDDYERFPKEVIEKLVENTRRNTKESIKEEFTLPEIYEEVKWLEFTNTEKLMYEAYLQDHTTGKYDEYLRKLCCHPNITDETKNYLANCKTMEDIENSMLKYYENKIKKDYRKYVKICDSIELNRRNLEKYIRKVTFSKLKRDRNININIDEENEENEENEDIEIEYENENEKEAYKKYKIDEIKEEMEKEINRINQDINIEIIKKEILDILKENKIKRNIKEKDIVIIQPNNETEKNRRNIIKERITALKEQKEKVKGGLRSYNFFKLVIDKMRKIMENEEEEEDDVDSDNFDITDVDLNSDTSDKENEKCNICLSTISNKNMTVTSCGHIFCYPCIESVITGSNRKCPTCRDKLSSNKIYRVIKPHEEKEKNEEEFELNKLRNEMGTKLANLVLYLKNNDKKTIIFSQWDKMLKNVGTILRECRIKNVFCKGNCFQRNKAVSVFNEEKDVKIIMLSSESSASGLNLTSAEQIIFLDLIYGNYEYRKNQENQAIGRAHRMGQKNKIKILRFLIKDTVEEEIYNLNKEQDRINELPNN